MSWDNCEAELHKPEYSHIVFYNRYVASLITVVATAIVLVAIRPPFILTTKNNGVHQPHLSWLRLGIISIVAGIIVLFGTYIVQGYKQVRALM